MLFIIEASTQGFLLAQCRPELILLTGNISTWYKWCQTVIGGNAQPHLLSPQVFTWPRGTSSGKRGVAAGIDMRPKEDDGEGGTRVVSVIGQI